MATIVSATGFKLLLLLFVVLTIATIVDVIQDNQIQYDHSNIQYFISDNNRILEDIKQILNHTSLT